MRSAEFGVTAGLRRAGESRRQSPGRYRDGSAPLHWEHQRAPRPRAANRVRMEVWRQGAKDHNGKQSKQGE